MTSPDSLKGLAERRGGSREQLTIIVPDGGQAGSRNRARWYGEGREWGTPPELFAALDAEFHFTLDPCALPANAKCVRYFTEAENGLEQSWAGERVFMNPPYGRELRRWVHKARLEAENGALVVGLLPASTDLDWWHDDILGARLCEIRYLRGRVRFVMPDGSWVNAWGSHVVVVWKQWREADAILALLEERDRDKEPPSALPDL